MKPEHVHRGQPGYPVALERFLGTAAPSSVAALGSPDIFGRDKVAIFCSVKCPGDLILATYDLACRLRDDGVTVIGGFHSPVEQECLRLLLRGRQPIIICPARSIENMRLPGDWKQPLAEGRLLLLSPFDATQRRMTAELAERRNDFVAALADRILVAHAVPGGKTEQLCRQVIAWGKPLLTFDHSDSASLLAIGATPWIISENHAKESV